jgi:hypothetical protein
LLTIIQLKNTVITLPIVCKTESKNEKDSLKFYAFIIKKKNCKEYTFNLILSYETNMTFKYTYSFLPYMIRIYTENIFITILRGI